MYNLEFVLYLLQQKFHVASEIIPRLYQSECLDDFQMGLLNEKYSTEHDKTEYLLRQVLLL